jgi:hypothetical protein
MAEFSKQYCELHNPQLEWDFDIDEIITEIPRGYYKSIICEGFGFIGVGIGMDRRVNLLFPDEGGGFDKVDYIKFMKNQSTSSDGI